MAKLKDFCTINPKASVLADDLEVSFVPMPKVGEQGEFDPSESKEYREVKKGFTNFQNGDVLFAKITPCMENGKGAVAKNLKNGYGFGSTEFHVLRPDYSKVTSEWLYYLTRWEEFRKEAEINMTGSAGQKRVPKIFLENYNVNLPELQKQKEMAEILDRIGELITLRKDQLAKLDRLVKSRFIELFGDGQYPKVALIDLIEEGAGLSYGIVQPGDDGTGDMGVLRPVDMVDGKISTASIKYIDRAIGDGFRKTELTGEELLITVRGTTGITALTDRRFKGMNVTRGIAVVRYDRGKINPMYLNAYLNTDESQRYIKEHTRGATLQQINLSDLRVQEIVAPPMEQQEQMAAFVEQTDKSKLAIQQSLDKLELLKKSLMQEYFG